MVELGEVSRILHVFVASGCGGGVFQVLDLVFLVKGRDG